MNSNPQLRSLCRAGGSHTLAVVAGVNYTGDDLCRTATAIAAGLGQRPEQTWALWLTSPYDFLCNFMALALAGKRILLPGNMQPATANLLATHFDALIARDTFPELGRPCFTPEQLNAGIEPPAFTPSNTDDIELLLFTSGSTGEPKAVYKTLGLLEAELRVLQQHWGARLGALPVLTTVSHQHIYGLLHLVLWPMLRRAPFLDEICQYPEELLARAQQQTAVVLVSSPTHLKRLPLVNDFIYQHQTLRHIVSSGGLLETPQALALASIMGVAPLEILGSTETGGVAWRQQHQSTDWRPLPGVECRQDADSDCLAVRSQHLGALSAHDGWYVMGDRVQWHGDGSFALCGRADRVVKVEGKRLSTTEMEARLQEHPFISCARVAVVRTRREEVGVAVELSPAGRESLVQLGKLALNQQLRDYLLGYFERPLLPRRWRYLAELPMNAQGKVVLADVQRLLQQKEA